MIVNVPGNGDEDSLLERIGLQRGPAHFPWWLVAFQAPMIRITCIGKAETKRRVSNGEKYSAILTTQLDLFEVLCSYIAECTESTVQIHAIVWLNFWTWITLKFQTRSRELNYCSAHAHQLFQVESPSVREIKWLSRLPKSAVEVGRELYQFQTKNATFYTILLLSLSRPAKKRVKISAV
jgi:hypothetical protein